MHVKKMSILAKVEFLAHFWQFGSVTFFWLGQKTKSDFFHKRITSYLLSKLIQWLEKCAIVIPQNQFGKFCYCGPPWGIFIYGFSGPRGGPLSPCNSLRLWSVLFIKIHFETLCWPCFSYEKWKLRFPHIM